VPEMGRISDPSDHEERRGMNKHPEPITIYGGGSWGTTLALLLGRRGFEVALWDRDPAQRARLANDRENRSFLPGMVFPPSIHVLSEAEVPAPSGRLVVLAVPSHGLRWLMQELVRGGEHLWIVATKGLEEGTTLTMSQVVRQVAGEGAGPIVVLAGPSLAREVAEEKPAAVLAASLEADPAILVQRTFATDYFRVYTSNDPMGVELGTSLKNVIALAAGIADGLGLGQNARGALLTRGLAEISRLGEAMGARPETFVGLAGVGDLVTTCTSPLSRNHTLGEALGRGEPLAGAMERIGMVVEGVRTTRAVCELAAKVKLEMPIAQQVYRILFEEVPPAVALRELMTRPLRAE
jgi:glycerol-3-phosphate dehydrogenase (NAD(P)+)